jgi:hypothetical protein
VVGIDIDDEFDTSTEIGEGGFDADVTIVGVTRDPGGEDRKTSDGREFTTRPQIIFGCRIDTDYCGYEGELRNIYLTLSPAQGGSWQIKSNTKAGIIAEAFETLGVGRDAEVGFRYQHARWSELLGLRFRLTTVPVQNPNRSSEEWKVEVPMELHGFDNEVRAESSLAAAELKS